MPFTKTALKKMKKDELIALVMKQEVENEELKKKNEEWAGVINTATAKIQRKYDELEGEYFEKEEELEEKQGELYNAEELLEEAEDGLEEIAKCLELEWNGIRGDTEIESVVSNIKKLKEECRENFDEAGKWSSLMYEYREKWRNAEEREEKLKEREELEWSFIDESCSVGEYKEYLKEFHPEYLKKTGWLSDSDEE